MGLGAAVGYGFGHGVGLVPDDVLAKIPPVRLKGEGHAPGDAYEVFGLEAFRRAYSVESLQRGEVFRVRASSMRPVAACVRVPQIYPTDPIGFQHSADLPEDGHHVGDVDFGCGIKAKLRVDAAGTTLGAFPPILFPNSLNLCVNRFLIQTVRVICEAG